MLAKRSVPIPAPDSTGFVDKWFRLAPIEPVMKSAESGEHLERGRSSAVTLAGRRTFPTRMVAFAYELLTDV